MNEHKCEKCEHEKECLDMVCFYELLEKEEGKIRADERDKVLDELLSKIDYEYYDGGYGTYYEVAEIARMIQELREQTGEGRKVD